MQVLSITHQPDAPSGVIGDAARVAGHDVEEASFAQDAPPRHDPAAYGAVIVFGGAARLAEQEQHPWVRDARAYTRAVVDAEVPLLGICLGSQLVADALGARVFAAPHPETGWIDVDLSPAAADDPLLGGLGPRLRAPEWHVDTFDLPPGAVELGRSDVALQAFRHGPRTWALQFHAEVTQPTFEGWIAKHGGEAGVDEDALRRETAELMPGWNDTGREICRRFLAVAGD